MNEFLFRISTLPWKGKTYARYRPDDKIPVAAVQVYSDVRQHVGRPMFVGTSDLPDGASAIAGAGAGAGSSGTIGGGSSTSASVGDLASIKNGLDYLLRIKSPVSALVGRVTVGTPSSLLQGGGCLTDSVGPAMSEAQRVQANKDVCRTAKVGCPALRLVVSTRQYRCSALLHHDAVALLVIFCTLPANHLLNPGHGPHPAQQRSGGN